MAHFDRPLTVTKEPSGAWRVEEPFRYYIGKDAKDFVDVPEGFITDFASVPRGLWNIVPPDGKYSQAAVVHDYLYSTHLFKRKKADQIFLEAMGVLGVSWWKRHTMYRAVRIFGGLSW